jgi:hypothetical protein
MVGQVNGVYCPTMRGIYHILAGSLLIGLASASQAFVYLQDDGTAEFSTLGTQHQVILTGFQVQAGAETIQNIVFYHFFDANTGFPFTYHLWTDPTNDGVPTDAILQQSVAATISSPTPSGGWQTTAITPQTLPIGSWFYVGVSQTHPNFSTFLGGNDTSGSFPPTGFHFTWATGPNPALLSTGTVAATGNYLIRANTTPVPEPATLAVLGCGGLVLLRRRKKQ